MFFLIHLLMLIYFNLYMQTLRIDKHFSLIFSSVQKHAGSKVKERVQASRSQCFQKCENKTKKKKRERKKIIKTN